MQITNLALNGYLPARIIFAGAAKQAESALLRTSQDYSWTYRPPGSRSVPVTLGNLVPGGSLQENIRAALVILAQTTFTLLVGRQESYAITPDTILDIFSFLARDLLYRVSPSWTFTKDQFKEVTPK
ncbi:MAG TPA: hypothetical protein VFV38_28875 [Ktedonobacteraceae bacterium]|nr:hypothetical protein [Ktedonobacteraceae bacterium]